MLFRSFTREERLYEPKGKDILSLLSYSLEEAAKEEGVEGVLDVEGNEGRDVAAGESLLDIVYKRGGEVSYRPL